MTKYVVDIGYYLDDEIGLTNRHIGNVKYIVMSNNAQDAMDLVCDLLNLSELGYPMYYCAAAQRMH